MLEYSTMGCLNSNQGFSHWFSNIHFSGACNRSCYFCIGQHMMALDPYDNLDKRNLDGFDEFIQKCLEHDIKEVNFTGSNTDPLLYKHQAALIADLHAAISDVKIGLRTNGALILKNPYLWSLYDKASISVTTLDPELYVKTMGQGSPPDLEKIIALRPSLPLKVNVVLCPEILVPKASDPYQREDLLLTIKKLRQLGIKKINLREPYGQPHIGDPMKRFGMLKTGEVLGMPLYGIGDTDVVYWDVHYVEVESVNLYANGVVSVTYPITKGHDPVTGDVKDQGNFEKSGRIREQWLNSKKKLPVISS
jgi:pyruvate-formate lyase-activating enzyme